MGFSLFIRSAGIIFDPENFFSSSCCPFCIYTQGLIFVHYPFSLLTLSYTQLFPSRLKGFNVLDICSFSYVFPWFPSAH